MKHSNISFLALLLVALLVGCADSALAHEKKCSADNKHHHKSHKSHKNHHKSHHKHHGLSSSKHSSDNEESSSKHTSKSSNSSKDNDISTSSKSNTTSTAKSSSKYTPGGRKAGLAGGDSLNKMKGSIGWMTSWTPNPYPGTDLGDVKFASMAWGIGIQSHDNDAKRWAEFKKVKPGKYEYVIGFNEADFSGEGSSGLIPPATAAAKWDEYIAPHGKAGSVLISPSCAKQQSETWMEPFLKAVKTQPDIINVHIFKNKAADIKVDLDHFAKYGKKMWITEMACIDYSSGTKYCSQSETDTFVTEAVKILEADDRVAAYAWSDAYNGPACKLTTNGSNLSQTGSLLKKVYSAFTKRDMVPEVVRREVDE